MLIRILLCRQKKKDFSQVTYAGYMTKLVDVGDDKIRDHCHITGKYRSFAHWSCNINLKLTEKCSCDIL